MPTARKHLVDLTVTNYYHCVSRCVRQAYLTGKDIATGKSFNHRKAWLVEKMKSLTKVFAIDICAYAVMSNHYHLVLRVNQEKALAWSNEEVVTRWVGLFKLSEAKHILGLPTSELGLHQKIIDKLRKQLYDISWFMRVLNEGIARLANKEDNCKGRFWEGRFKSQALLDEAAVLTCMSYVDLNPIRANISKTPEMSDYTSIQDRIKAYKKGKQPESIAPLKTERSLDPQESLDPLSIHLHDYFHLLDTSGRIIREGKSGAIPNELRPLLERLKVSPDNWFLTITQFSEKFEAFIGTPRSIEKFRRQRKNRRFRGLNSSNQAFLTAA